MSSPSLSIVCASSVAGGKEAFSTMGRVTVVPESGISPATLHGADMLITRSKVKVNDHLLEGSSLSFYGTATAGFDHVDVDALARRKIAWSQAPGSNANSVAEYVLAALSLLGLNREMSWEGKTLGIIGAGHVGSRLASVAATLGIKVLLNDPPLRAKTGNAHYRPLFDVLEKSDIVSLHVPLVDGGEHPTRGMADSVFFASLKPGVVFINASRGEVVNEPALSRAAVKGIFSAIILDVFDHEPDISIDTLKLALLATPHIAGYSLDGRLKGTEMVYRAACRQFGIEPSWNVPAVAQPVHVKIESPMTGSRALYETIIKAYNPADDDQRLRSLPVGMPMRNYFQTLRQQYPERREFPHFSVSSDLMDASLENALVGIGFKIHSAG
jgi:erythronate-4-phosphate dehydrogenase